MSESTQMHLALGVGSEETDNGFYTALNYIRENANTQYGKGRLFERLIQKYFTEDPFYKKRFSEVWLWAEWAETQPQFDRVDRGIDLVAKERDGGYCAIQCKCYAEDTKITERDLSTFILYSNREPFTARIFVDTSGGWTNNLRKTVDGLQPLCYRISAADLASRPVKWPDLSLEAPEQLDYQLEYFDLREHQEEAFNDVINGFKDSDRGKLIMACGTGKTFTALRVAEEIAGIGGRVLYLVPSIGLFSQAMREWSEQQGISHSYIGICSDTRAGKTSEDASILELEIQVTTDHAKISEKLQNTDENNMKVVFCTYHSLPIIEAAQDGGAPAFDMVLCDEAHRTTGIENPDPDEKTSPFVLVHDKDRIRAKKRLYMTATARIYTEGAKVKASRHDIEVYSMDDPETYGEEFHRLPFSKAVDEGLLTDYKVVLFTTPEQDTDAALQGYVGAGGSEINISDATKIVGCWRALQNPERKPPEDPEFKPLTRAIAFSNTIATSKRVVEHWDGIIESATEQMPEDQRPLDFKCETAHVDGTVNALERKKHIEWLKGNSDGVCRILSNARCLSEGIDVPALDAVLFMDQKNSHIDIVQAVGRVMRKAEGKDYGYIVLPIAIPEGADPTRILDDNKRFAAVWGVLRALRSHDDRRDAEINKIDLNTAPPDWIIFPPGGGSGTDGEGTNGSDTLLPTQMHFDFEIPADKLFAKIVEKCGDRKYWESWAKDVADIYQRITGRIESLLNNPDNDALREWFDDFHTELKSLINDAITRKDAVGMMAQHILTRPVFKALFENYDFASRNPVAIALDKLKNDFGEFGLEEETRDLEDFYESVQKRARGIDNSEGRQKVLLELYQKFFQNALKDEAKKLGVVYTPIEVVDFILYSAGGVLQDEFGLSLSDEDVHILDPFTGAGVFLSRLIQSDLIQASDLERKYREELHANEFLLLAYYIAAVNIEEVFHGWRGKDSVYEPFNGIVLTDTFNLNKKENPTLLPKEWLPQNNTRAEGQQQLPIQVVVGNPPWSVDRDKSKVEYPELEDRIKETYLSASDAQQKRSLYDSYKMAIRWASDRIGEQGIVAFVTNGSLIEGDAEAGLRACLAREFSSIHVLNLRGDAYTSDEHRRSEGGNVFGEGTRTSVAITILVKNPNTTHDGCQICYRDIGNYLTREQKLEVLREAKSITGFNDWQSITPNEDHDWIRPRSKIFAGFRPLGSKEAMDGNADDAIFKLYSNGYQTGRDAYIYNFSRDACAENAQRMIGDYLAAISDLEKFPELTLAEVMERHNSINWDDTLERKLKGKQKTKFRADYIRKAMRRPFVATNCYGDYMFAQRKGKMHQIFPEDSSENRVICVPGKGATGEFSALIVDTMPDRGFNGTGQCFPRYKYPEQKGSPNTVKIFQESDNSPERVDNILDTALCTFRERYPNDTISKDDIFNYVYGLLHAPCYRKEFANDLSKMIPRIPFAPEFSPFAEAGAALATLHLNYETCEQYPLELVFMHDGEPQPRHFQLGKRAMRFADDEKTMLINDHIRVSGIPEEAHRYVVSGKTPLEWFIDRYKFPRSHENNGIANDPNGWFENPRDLITAIERIVYVSVESTKIIESLPSEVTSN